MSHEDSQLIGSADGEMLLEEISELEDGLMLIEGEDDSLLDLDEAEKGHRRRDHHCRRACSDDSSSSHHEHGRRHHRGGHHDRKPCRPTTTRCIRPTNTCCRRTTTSKVTTYILRRTTTTSVVTSSVIRSTTTTAISRSTTSVTVTDSQTITATSLITSRTTSTSTISLPNTTFTLTRTSTQTLPNKTIVSIVTEQIMPCFTAFETCFYNCPYYDIEPTGRPCGREVECCPRLVPRPVSCPLEPVSPCHVNLACANGWESPCCQPTRLYVLPGITNHCNIKPTHDPIPACGCWNQLPQQTVTVTLEPPRPVVPCCPPVPTVTITVQPNVFCTTEIVCAYYTPLAHN